jgi:hypothetical protein
MNNSNPLPSQPPPLNLPPDPTPRRSPARPPGEDPAESEAIPNAILVSETIWQPRRVMFQLRQPGAGKLIGAMLFVGLVRSLVYGVVAGTFSPAWAVHRRGWRRWADAGTADRIARDTTESDWSKPSASSPHSKRTELLASGMERP